MKCACVVKIPSNLHVCFLNRACSLIPARLRCKSTADATRERRHKTNRRSQRCTRLCSTAFLPVSATSFVFSSVTAHQQRRRQQPHVLSFAPYIHVSPVSFFSFLFFFFFFLFFILFHPTARRQCRHETEVVIKFLLRKCNKGRDFFFFLLLLLRLNCVVVMLAHWGQDVDGVCKSFSTASLFKWRGSRLHAGPWRRKWVPGQLMKFNKYNCVRIIQDNLLLRLLILLLLFSSLVFLFFC